MILRLRWQGGAAPPYLRRERTSCTVHCIYIYKAVKTDPSWNTHKVCKAQELPQPFLSPLQRRSFGWDTSRHRVKGKKKKIWSYFAGCYFKRRVRFSKNRVFFNFFIFSRSILESGHLPKTPNMKLQLFAIDLICLYISCGASALASSIPAASSPGANVTSGAARTGGGDASTLPKSRRKRYISQNDMVAILDYHNKVRGRVFPPASNMEYMVSEKAVIQFSALRTNYVLKQPFASRLKWKLLMWLSHTI